MAATWADRLSAASTSCGGRCHQAHVYTRSNSRSETPSRRQARTRAAWHVSLGLPDSSAAAARGTGHARLTAHYPARPPPLGWLPAGELPLQGGAGCRARRLQPAARPPGAHPGCQRPQPAWRCMLSLCWVRTRAGAGRRRARRSAARAQVTAVAARAFAARCRRQWPSRACAPSTFDSSTRFIFTGCALSPRACAT